MRSLAERLEFELVQIREELREAVAGLSPEELEWAPAEGMKSYRAQLVEIGAMQAEAAHFVATGEVPSWESCEAAVIGDTTADLMASLDSILESMLTWLRNASDEVLRSTVPSPEHWVPFFGTSDLEREELIRWAARHEYYHLAQIIVNRWSQGRNPYKLPEAQS